MLKFKMYRVLCFAPSPVHVLDKFPHGERFFFLCGKNLFPCGKFNDIDAKQISAILPVRELAKDRLFTLCWWIYRTGRDFYRTGRKILWLYKDCSLVPFSVNHTGDSGTKRTIPAMKRGTTGYQLPMVI
jgi:hypothetical protein